MKGNGTQILPTLSREPAPVDLALSKILIRLKNFQTYNKRINVHPIMRLH